MAAKQQVETSNINGTVEGDLLSAVIGQTIELAPEEFVLDDVLNVRPDDGRDPAKEQEKLEELAKSLWEEGQIHEASAYPVINGDGVIEYHLWAGNRRRAAIAWGNVNLKGDKRLLRVRITSQEEARKLRRKAIHENIKREGFSPIQFAQLIERVRKDEGWEGQKDTKRVAAYFGVSVTQITQHEKLLAAPAEAQAKMVQLSMATDPALFLASAVKPEAQAEIADDAQKLAEEEAKSTPQRSDRKPKKITPQKKHVVAAAKKKNALTAEVPVTRKELLEEIAVIRDSDCYGHLNSPVRKWADYFIEKYATGKVQTSRGLRQLFDEMVMDPKTDQPYAGLGTPTLAEKEEAKAIVKASAKPNGKPVTANSKAGAKPKVKAAGK